MPSLGRAKWLRLVKHSAVRPLTLSELMKIDFPFLNTYKKERPKGIQRSEFEVENSDLYQAKFCCRNKQNLSGLHHRDLFSCSR